MAYRFKLDDPIEKGFRRIAREQIDRALSELSPLEVGPGGVHQCRKALKRLRALLALVAPAIGDKAAKRHHDALRNTARLLAAPRENVVLLDTIAKVTAAADPSDRPSLQPLRDEFARRSAELSRPLDGETAQQARIWLVKESKRLSKTRFKHRGFDALALEAAYQAGRRALKRAYAKPSDEAFHDLRKAVQLHWRHMALLSRAWPEVFEARVAAARELSQILGDDHDLAMLAGAVAADATASDQIKAVAERVCRSEQQKLREAAEHRLLRLYTEPPGAFRRRIAAYWLTGRHIHPAEAAKKVDAPPSAPSLVAVDAADAGPIATKPPSPSQRRA